MPIYEYRCLACKRRTSVFVRSVSSPTRASCEHCGGKRLSRLVSKFAVHGRGADFDTFDDVDESDPESVARFARRMGEDLGPELDEMVGRMETGESPADLMGGDDADFDDDF